MFGNLYGLVNMSLFLILANYLAALVAVQLLRGDMSSSDNMNFKEIYNSFLAMYAAFMLLKMMYLSKLFLGSMPGAQSRTAMNSVFLHQTFARIPDSQFM